MGVVGVPSHTMKLMWSFPRKLLLPLSSIRRRHSSYLHVTPEALSPRLVHLSKFPQQALSDFGIVIQS